MLEDEGTGPGAAPNTEGHKSILLVEDDAIISMAQALVLRKNGYGVTRVLSGAEGVECALSVPGFDLILMDINLEPGIDGIEAAREILRHRHVPIVFLTSHDEPEYVRKVRSVTRYGYVLKHTGEFTLLRAVETGFDLYETHQKLAEREELYRSLSEDISAYIMVLSADGIITYANPATVTLLGCDGAGVSGCEFISLLSGEDRIRVGTVLADLSPGTPVRSLLHRFSSCSHSYRWVHSVFHGFFDSDGEVTRFQVIAQDMTGLVDPGTDVTESAYYKAGTGNDGTVQGLSIKDIRDE
jgi:PAS domain S-box-containing protein